jgi:hypothetical protein
MDRNLSAAIVDFLVHRAHAGSRPTSAAEITAHTQAARPTVNRHLSKLVAAGQIVRQGVGPATVYLYSRESSATGTSGLALAPVSAAIDPPLWSYGARTLRAALEKPLGCRAPVSYQRRFVDENQPNRSSLLPAKTAAALYLEGRTQGQQPAGTYPRKVLEQLLIDLSWYSSRLEGNRKTLLDTRELFAKGRSSGDDPDTVMLLNLDILAGLKAGDSYGAHAAIA